jgi:ech hydrogenase subunit B
MGGAVMNPVAVALCFVVLAPLLGGMLAGVDRVVTARMQARVGPPILQPFYDVGKLLRKDVRRVNPIAEPLLLGHLGFMVLAGVLLVGGGDLIFVMFVLALSALFLALAAGSANTPYSHAGASRELIVLLASEPFFLLMAAAVCASTGVSTFGGVLDSTTRVAAELPAVLLAFLFVITIKLRKSPFDISAAHHAHQELVRGLTTDLSGRQLAWVEVAHWYESAILAALVVLFFNWSIPLGVAVFLVAYAAEVLVDNSTARARWQLVLRSTWTVTLLLTGGNLLALYLWER